MESSERAIEAGQAADDAARDREVARIRQSVQTQGGEDCIACGEPIGAKRRAALPSAVRCIACQNAREARR